MAAQRFDPWTQVTTRHGYAADEVVSALQKSIRRADEALAVRFACEMYLTSQEMEAFLWKRLMVISVEDIGPANPYLSGLIDSLERMRLHCPYGSGDRALFAVHAVRALCASPKSRSNDLMYGLVRRELEAGEGPEIPPYALDMHTRRGQEMGRDLEHFLTEASRIVPPAPQDEPHAEALRRYLAKEKEE